jgi:hypothetical protein
MSRATVITVYDPGPVETRNAVERLDAFYKAVAAHESAGFARTQEARDWLAKAHGLGRSPKLAHPPPWACN